MCHMDRNTKFLFLDDNMKFLENNALIFNLYNWNCSRDFGEPTLSYSADPMHRKLVEVKNLLVTIFQSLTFSCIIL